MFRYLLGTAIISCLFVFISGGGFLKGKSKVELETISDCKDDKPQSDIHVTVGKCNKTHKCIDAHFTLPEVIGPKSTMQLIGRKWNTGGWANNAFTIKLNDACKNLDKILGKNWNVVRNEVGLTCPAQPGTYQLKDFFVDFGDLPIAFMVGKYEIKFKLVNNNRLILCEIFTINVSKVM